MELSGAERGKPLKPMTFDEFMTEMLAVFPNAFIEQDPTGELIVTTGLYINDAAKVVPIPLTVTDGGAE